MDDAHCSIQYVALNENIPEWNSHTAGDSGASNVPILLTSSFTFKLSLIVYTADHEIHLGMGFVITSL